MMNRNRIPAPAPERIPRSSPLVLALVVLGVISGPREGFAASVRTSGMEAAVFQSISAAFPKRCSKVVMGMSGLCLLASTSPRVKTRFFLRTPDGRVRDQPIALNEFNPLSPGSYLLYSEGGMDALHEQPVTIYPGALSSIKTATLKLQPAGKQLFRIQHYQSESGINGRGCAAKVLDKGVLAVLPGNYQVNLVPDGSQAQPQCFPGGTTVNLLGGRGFGAQTRKVAAQSLPAGNIFRHPNGVSALATVSQFMHPVDQLGLLPKWRSYQGVQNPHVKAYDAMVFRGVGTAQFVVPFEWRKGKRECGLSLAEAGLPAHVLMTDCQFSGGRLTGFRINPGAYYTLNNRHGKTAVEGNFINNPIVVSGVAFDPKGGN